VSLELSEVSKRYGDVVALDRCSMRVRPGRLVGLLGPNGAGKTTLMRAVLGLVDPDGGSLRWDGHEITAELRRRIGYMPEERGLYPAMPVGEQVVHFARLSGLAPAAAHRSAVETLRRVGLGEQADRRVEQLSHGNQQRAQLAVALVHAPDLLVLDEPFAGLDPLGVDDLAALLRGLAAEGRTVVLSSHQLDLVGSLCEEVVILDHGRVVLTGDLAELRAKAVQRRVDLELAGDAAPGWPPVPEGGRVVAAGPRRATVLVDRSVDLAALLGSARSFGDLLRFDFAPPSLEDMFHEAVER
jgi:ABC-2 type transport system ATP-binding protein